VQYTSARDPLAFDLEALQELLDVLRHGHTVRIDARAGELDYQHIQLKVAIKINMSYNPKRSSADGRIIIIKLTKGDKRMKMTKKQMGLGVAVIAALVILWSVFKPAPAEAADVDFTFGAERKVEAETNAMYLDSHVDLWAGIGATSGLNYDVDDNMNATFNSFELDFDKDIGERASVYVNNDFDVNLDHTETVIGFKLKF